MGKTRRYLLLLIICLFIFSLSGCTSEDKSAEEVVKGFVTAYYTVDKDDFEFHNTITSPSLDLTTRRNLEEIMTKNTKEFKPYLSEEGYMGFMANRLYLHRLKEAVENNYYAEVKSIKLGKSEKTESITGLTSMTYKFTVEILQKFINNSEEKTVTIENKLRVYKYKDKNDPWYAAPDLNDFVFK